VYIQILPCEMNTPTGPRIPQKSEIRRMINQESWDTPHSSTAVGLALLEYSSTM
jgi:hypothetical protein